jgi:bifunctional DNA-binding transcriptional regulator/antitoxin component of YhaV-PrlF toxin-antitoxin module
LTETILPPDANRTETHLISKGSAPQVSPDGSVQLLTRRRGSRELFPSSWLRTPAEVRHAGGITEGTRLEFCSTELILQAKEGRTSIQKMAAGLRDLNNVPEVTWEDVASRGEKVMKEIGERESRRLALPHILAVA